MHLIMLACVKPVFGTYSVPLCTTVVNKAHARLDSQGQARDSHGDSHGSHNDAFTQETKLQ